MTSNYFEHQLHKYKNLDAFQDVTLQNLLFIDFDQLHNNSRLLVSLSHYF
jgi:hypothetical protein